jgi:acetate kinase
MVDAILTLNAGSSSIKFALFQANAALKELAAGEVENIGIAPHLKIRLGGALVSEHRWPEAQKFAHEDMLTPILHWVEDHLGASNLIATGHRIVHGGELYFAPTRLTDTVLAELAKLDPLAPLHEPHNLAAVDAARKLRPNLPQIGCFDTAFHHDMPVIAKRFPIPRVLHDEGIHRYGFHGLSYEYISGNLRDLAPNLAAGRVIAAHLGNGASLCAMKNGASIDSTMGMTGLDGQMMGTRCGAIDPGAILYFMQARNMSAAAITDLVYKQSGLLGVSGLSADVRTLLESPAPEAVEALDLFAYLAARHAGALASSLAGLDAFIFTAGIGEHSAPTRAAICARLAWLGLELDPAANAAHAPVISTPSSRVEIRIIPTNEELQIARHCLAFLN